ncbi:MAG: type II-A CRISPR-associated protein Csn2 [Ruoffia tabacinasalis]|uniref:type II-A CRISPR-associated protein Csn2 n=1 Tax=Lactobacillales TaxID=186826 RepID=UPI00388AFFC6
MMLNFKLLDEPIRIRKMTTLIIEDVSVFTNLVELFYRYNEESELKVFDKKFKTIKDSELLIVTDILGYNINSTSLLKLVYADLEDQLNEKPEVRTMIDKLTSTISDLIEYELIDHELDLESADITVQQLFKALGVRIEVDNDTIFEKVIEIIKVFKYLTRKKLLVFINACSYLKPEELLELREYISLYNAKVLFLEPRKVPNINQYILDNDYFLMEENGII